MGKTAKYEADYAAIYPGVEISDEVMAVLRTSDRKMRYMEQDLKRERPVKGENGEIAAVLPSREDSYERLLETDMQFVDEFSADPELLFIKKTEIFTLRRCLSMLDGDERALITALYFDEMTEREYAAVSGLSKSAVNRRRQSILDKLKKFLEI